MALPATSHPNYHHHFRTSLFAVTGLLGLLLVVTLSLPVEVVSAQPQRPTRNAPQFTPPAPPTREPPVIPTRTPSGNPAATVEYLATHLALDPDDLQATAQALLTTVPTLPADFDPQSVIDWLTGLIESGEVSYDPFNHTLTVTASLSETALNTVIHQALITAGYDPSIVTVDLVDGAMAVTAEDVQLNDQVSGTLHLTLTFNVVEGQIAVSITQATLNGVPVPAARLDDLLTTIQEAIGTLGMTPPGDLDYTVDSLAITDDALIITVTFVLPTGLARP